MTLKNAFGDLALDSSLQELNNTLESPAQEPTLEAIRILQQDFNTLTDTILYLTNVIAERLPRVTGNDQMACSVEGTATVAIAASQTLATLTTLGTINAVGSKFASGDNMNLAGASHIYNNIIVS